MKLLNRISLFINIMLTVGLGLRAATFNVNVAGDANTATGGTFTAGPNTGDLRGCLNYFNFNTGSGPHTITFTLPMDLIALSAATPLPILNIFAAGSLTINGSNTMTGGTMTLSGSRGGFSIAQGTVNISNLILNTTVTGGAGGGGGGAGAGALGAGGGLFIDGSTLSGANVTLTNVQFSSCAATGGAGANGASVGGNGGGGGGGMNGGTGGTGGTLIGSGGGGWGGAGGAGLVMVGIPITMPAAGGGGAGGAGGTVTSSTGGGGGGGGYGLSASGGNGGGAVGSAGTSGGNLSTGAVTAIGGGGGGGGTTTGGNGGGNGGVSAGRGGSGGGSQGSMGNSSSGGTRNGFSGTNAGGGGGGGAPDTGVGSDQSGGAGGAGGGGGGGDNNNGTGLGGNGGYGGGGGGFSGNGGFGGGGGTTGIFSSSGNGGFGGGGSGGGRMIGFAGGGNGGFGGGGGGNHDNACLSSFSEGCVGGGNGGCNIANGGGGGGAGFGGAIFINKGPFVNTLTIQDTCSTAGSAVTGGAAGTSAGTGAAVGTDAFIVSGATFNFNPATASTVTFSGSIADDSAINVPAVAGGAMGGGRTGGSGTGGAVTKNGAGTTILSSATGSTYIGPTTINAGTLQANAVNTLSNNSPVVFANAAGAILNLNSNNNSIPSLAGGGATGGNVTLGSATLTLSATSGSTTYLGAISGTGGIAKSAASIQIFSGASNSYSGTTAISGSGTLRAGAANAFSSNSAVTLANTASTFLDLNSFNCSVASLAGGGAAGGNVTLGSGTLTLAATTGGPTTYTGAITGTGGLTVNMGAGIVQILNAVAGTNTYGGTTTVTSGTLRAGATNTLPVATAVALSAGGTLDLNTFNLSVGSLSGSGGTVSLNAQTLTLGATTGGPATYTGAITGTGGLTVNLASGVVQILNAAAGTNTYSGMTSVNGGTLRAGAVNAFSSSSVVTLMNAAGAILDLNGNNNTVPSISGGGALGGNITLGSGTLTLSATMGTTTYTGAISGSGGVAKTGASTQILDGTSNNYSGTTAVNGGVLQAGAVNAFSASSTVVMANTAGASLNLNGFDNAIGSISGGGTTGGNVAIGAATLTLGGDNTSTSFAGSMTGMNVIKNGTGTFSVTNANIPLTGQVTVNNGVFQLVGTNIGSSFLVNGSGTLRGTGTIAQGVTVSGEIRPGNSIGTMTISGPLVLNPGALTTIEVDPTISSLIAVTGTASIAGNVSVIFNPGTYTLPLSYTFLTATGGVTGTFSSAILGSGGPDDAVAQFDYSNPNAVTLEFVFAPIDPTPLPPGNPRRVLNYIVKFCNVPPISSICDILSDLTPDELADALASISPGRNAVSTFVSQNDAFGFVRSVVGRMVLSRLRGAQQPAVAAMVDGLGELDSMIAKNEVPAQLLPAEYEGDDEEDLAWNFLFKRFKWPSKEEPAEPPENDPEPAPKGPRRSDIWVQGIGEWYDQKAQDEFQIPSFHAWSGGAVAAYDWYRTENAMVTMAAGYAKGNISQSNMSGSYDAYFLMFAGTAYAKNGFCELGIGGLYNRYKNDRHVSFPGFDAHAKSAHSGEQLIPHIAFGYDFNWTWATLEPFIRADCSLMLLQGYSEHGADPLNMKMAESKSALLRSEAGINAYQVVRCGETTSLVFHEAVSYVNLQPWSTGTVSAALVGFPPGFTVNSFQKNQSLLSPTLEFLIRKTNGFYASLLYYGEFGKEYRSNEAAAKLGWFF